MTSFLDPLIAFVSTNAWLAYVTLFLAALLEAVPVVGSVIPGSTIILALSALVPGGELRLEWVLGAAIAGALIGDGSAFWIGHRSQREILSAWPMTQYPRVVAQSEAFFHRWGALAVFFARFVLPGPVLFVEGGSRRGIYQTVDHANGARRIEDMQIRRRFVLF